MLRETLELAILLSIKVKKKNNICFGAQNYKKYNKTIKKNCRRGTWQDLGGTLGRSVLFTTTYLQFSPNPLVAFLSRDLVF